MRITQLRIFAIVLTMLGTLLTIVAFSTNDWYGISTYSQFQTKSVDFSYGLFYYCADGDCSTIKTKESWRKAVIGLMAAAVILGCMSIVIILSVIFCNKKFKHTSILMLLSAFLQLATLIIFPLKMNLSRESSLGISYYVACVGLIVSAGAGIIAFASKEEQVAPFHDISS